MAGGLCTWQEEGPGNWFCPAEESDGRRIRAILRRGSPKDGKMPGIDEGWGTGYSPQGVRNRATSQLGLIP